MSYQVIARKYRPQRFADVVGQNHVTQTLSNAIASGRIAHAYLFCGPRGTGKTTLARIFAKCLNCTGGPLADFPEDDPRAKEIAEGRSLDVVEIDGASNNGVDQVRELRETARFAPASSKFKIYIIDEVHMLSTAAFNALLKTLEEPPSHVKFLFATTDPEKVLPTILSRCQRFDLRRIPTALIVKHLSWIASQEGVSIDDAALHAIARGADGGMRDAESTLDQLISFCGNQIVESDVLSMFGLAARSQLLGLSSAIVNGDAAQALTLLDELARNGKDLSRLLGDLLNHFRNLLLFQLTKGDKNLLEASEIELGVLATEAKRIETEPLSRIMEVFSTAESRLRDAASRRIFLEVTLLKAIQARESTSLDAVLKQLQALRQAASTEGAKASSASRAPAGSPPPPTAVPATAAAKKQSPPEVAPVAIPPPSAIPAPEQRATPSNVPKSAAAVAESTAKHSAPTAPAAPTPAPSTVEAPVAAPQIAPGTDPIQAWNVVVNGLSMMQRHYFEEAQPTAYTNNVLTVSYPIGSDSFELANSRDILNALQAQYAANGFANLSVKLIENPQLQGAAKPAARPNPSPNPTPRPQENAPQRQDPKAAAASAKPQPMTLSKDEFLNDPLIRAALEVFKATLVEVRAPSPESAA